MKVRLQEGLTLDISKLLALEQHQLLVGQPCGVLTSAGCQMPTQKLSHSPSPTGQGEKIR